MKTASFFTITLVLLTSNFALASGPNNEERIWNSGLDDYETRQQIYERQRREFFESQTGRDYAIAQKTDQELNIARNNAKKEMLKLSALGAGATVLVGITETVPFLSVAPNGFLGMADGGFSDVVFGGLITGILEIGPALARKARGDNMDMSAYRCVQKICRETWGAGSLHSQFKSVVAKIDKELAFRKASQLANASTRRELSEKKSKGGITQAQTPIAEPTLGNPLPGRLHATQAD